MKKAWIGMLVCFVSFIIIGCSKDDKIYKEMMEQGHKQIEKGAFARAENFFIKALEEKPEDQKAKVLLKQTRDILNAQKRFDEGNFEAAVTPAEHARELDGGSDALREKAKSLLDEMKKMKSLKKEYAQAYEEAKQQFEEGNYDGAIQTLEEILDNELKHPFYTDIRDNSDDLLKEAKAANEKAAAAAEAKAKAKEEAEAKAKAEAEAKAKAKAETEAKAKAEAAAEKEKKEAEAKAKKDAASKDIGAADGYWLTEDKTEACHITSTYLACAVKQSDVMFKDTISNIHHKSDTEIELTFKNGHKTTLILAGKDFLKSEAGNMHRVSKEEANAIYDGYYKLP